MSLVTGIRAPLHPFFISMKYTTELQIYSCVQTPSYDESRYRNKGNIASLLSVDELHYKLQKNIGDMDGLFVTFHVTPKYIYIFIYIYV